MHKLKKKISIISITFTLFFSLVPSKVMANNDIDYAQNSMDELVETEPNAAMDIEIDTTYLITCPAKTKQKYIFQFSPDEDAGYYMHYENDLNLYSDMNIGGYVLDEEGNKLASTGGNNYYMLEANKVYIFEITVSSVAYSSSSSAGSVTMSKYCDWEECVILDSDGYAIDLLNDFLIVRLPDGTLGMKKNTSYHIMYDIQTLIVPESIQVDISDNDFWNADYRYETIGINGRYLAENGVLYDQKSQALRYVPNTLEGSYTVKDETKIIGKSAFSTTKLEEIIIPDSVERFDGNIFPGNNETIKTIRLPSSIDNMSGTQFSATHLYGLFALENLEVSQNSTVYETRENVLFKKKYDDKWILFFYPLGKKDITYTIPDDVVELGKYSFARIRKSATENNPTRYLKYLRIPDTVKSCYWFLQTEGNYSSYPELTLIGNINSPVYSYWNTYFSTSKTIKWETIGEYERPEKFTLGIDNNSFYHIGSDISDSGFYGYTNHYIDESDYIKLMQHDMNDGTRDYLRHLINGDDTWNGSCYGIATVLSLVYNNNLEISDFSVLNAPNIYDMLRPCEDLDYLSIINYYQLMQYLNSPCDYGVSIDEPIADEEDIQKLFTILKGYLDKGQLVLMLVPGHAVVVTEYEESGDNYIFKVYDENSVLPSDPYGLMYDLVTNKDFTDFECTELGINQDNFNQVIIMDPISVEQGTNYVEDNNAIIADMSENFIIEDNNGNILKNSNDSLEYTMDIQKMQQIYNTHIEDIGQESLSDCKFILNNDANEYTISEMSDTTDITIYNDNGFISLQGNNIESATIVPGEGIIIDGERNCSYTITLDTDEIVADNETGLVEISGSINDGTVEISNENEDIIISGDNEISDLEIKSYIKNESLKIESQESLNSGEELTIQATDCMEDEQKVMLGDVNYDGEITYEDSVLILQSDSKIITLNEYQKSVSDVNYDGTINYNDAVQILRYDAGLIKDFNWYN